MQTTKRRKMSEETEITFGDQQTYQHTLKINNFTKFMNIEEEVSTNYMNAFPGKKIAFVVKPEAKAPNGSNYHQYHHLGEGWTKITENDKFISLTILAAKGLEPPCLAGKIDIQLAGTSQTFSFGDPEKGKYEKLLEKKLVIKPKKIAGIQAPGYTGTEAIVPRLVHLKLTGAVAEEDILVIKLTLFYPGEVTKKQDQELPESLKSSSYLTDLNMKIMRDTSTANLKISFGDKKNKKTFTVHKNFLCARSPVFRAAIESDMMEGKTSEIYIKDVDEKTLKEMIHYIYTGELTGVDLDVQMVALMADKYDLPGMMDLMCFRMKEAEVEDEYIADMLIAARRHDSEELQKIAMDKLRTKKEILRDPTFRKKFKGDQNILFDLIHEFIMD